MSKPVRLDPIRNLLTRRRAEPNAAYSADDVDELLKHYKTLQDKIHQQHDMIAALEQDRKSDPVTGLANRTTLVEEIERSLATAKRYGRSHALLKLVVDNFDGYNAMGADTAVAVLTHIARVLRQSIRTTDIAARPHGNEFCVILNELRALENAEMRAAEIARAVAASPCITPHHTLPVSVAVGAVLFGMDDSVDSIFSRVNGALANTPALCD